MEEIGFDFPRVNRENLNLAFAEESILSERRICELSEIAASAVDFALDLFDRGFDVLEVLSLVAEELSFSSVGNYTYAMEENKHRLDIIASSLQASDKAVFAELLTQRLVAAGVMISELSFLPIDEQDEMFTYVKNAYSDEAYDVLSQDFDDPRLKYSPSFKEAVRALSDGEVSYALLPLEEFGGTRLPTVTELIYRNDLKINAVTPVFGPDGTSELKYALVSLKLFPSKFDSDDDRYLEIRLSVDASDRLSSLMLAAEMYKIEIYRINTVTFESDGEMRSFFNVVFRAEGGEFTKLFVFLTLFTDDFTPVGMYNNLE